MTNLTKTDLSYRIRVFLEKFRLNKNNKTVKNLYTKDITDNKTYYRTYKLSASFGQGILAKKPWMAFLKHGFKTSNGVYPYFSIDIDTNLLISHIGFSNEHKVYLSDDITNKIKNFNNSYSLKKEFYIEEEINERLILEITDYIDKMIDFFNTLDFTFLHKISLDTYLTREQNYIQREGIYLEYSKTNDTWNDFGYSGFYNLIINYKNNNLIFEDGLKILFLKFNDNKSEYDLVDLKTINSLNNKNLIKLNTFTNDEEISFISQIQEDKFYRKLAKEYDFNFCRYILALIHDAGVCKDKFEFDSFINLTKHEYFDKSLIRNSEAYYCYKKGSLFLTMDNMEPNLIDLEFEYKFQLPRFKDSHNINLTFKDKSLYKGSINLFIGKNGLGKSYALKKLIEYLSIDDFNSLVENNLISNRPVINKLLVISNVYDDNFVSKKTDIKKNTFSFIDYKYINLLKNRSFNNQEKNISRINLSIALKEILRYKLVGYQKINKIDILIKVLKNIIDFDHILITNNNKEEELFRIYSGEREQLNFISRINEDNDLKFIKNDSIVYFSSGQLTFIKYLFYVLAFIEQDSLVIIDEPENFLHPNLEMELIKLLYQILELTNSVCIIATHSTHMSREVSRYYINEFSLNDNSVDIFNPAIETFGNSLEFISDNIFKDLDKRNRYFYKKLIELTNDNNYEEIRKKYSKDLNIETLSYLKRLIDGN